ncbi:30S ribosomal protein S11 [Marinitoga sp. 38H-ov]|uniref:30S ribosomal protein S11 n=1 Tax=Marinitoga sp. 38H-ov TaxID=1755814 RepID=UPI0013EA1590|nr:30S ribosomal protein S11 [Marinitoga sp. 38H-ov]KAF2955986.1 30S ribosomal protein S11 [Marinitoga sp. 38H-ov]
MARRTTTQKKKKISLDKAVVHIQSTFNNTIITLSDPSGNTLLWASGGTAGFSGTKKGTPYASQLAADKIAKEALKFGVKKLDVYVKGPGAGRESAIRTLQAAGLVIENIKDKTPIPHNGCRPKKRKGM